MTEKDCVMDVKPAKAIYGWGRVRPRCLQRIHSARFLLACLCLCAVTQGMLTNGMIPVSLSSLERRFSLDSFQLGTFVSAYDVGVLICLIPFTHFGGKGHKGRWMGGCMLIVAIGSFVCVIPQFMSHPQHLQPTTNTSSTELCNAGGTDQSQKGDGDLPHHSWYYILLLLGNFLHGVGGTPLYTIGITYLDESVNHETSALYLGIFLGSSLFGPILGYIGGGALLRINGDFLKHSQEGVSGLTPDDEQWYGAWWLGFVIAGFMALLSSLLMFGFARRVPDAPDLTAEDKLAVGSSGNHNHMQVATSWNEFYTGVKSIFNSTAFMFLCIVDVLEGLLSTGVVSFFPKIVQSFYGLSPSKASLLTGAIIVPAAVFGNLLGGYTVKKFKLHATGMIAFAIVVDCISLIFGTCFIFYCPLPDLVGVNTHAHTPVANSPTRPPTGFNITNVCNLDCHCMGVPYQPICDHQHKLSYFSPCSAGCRSKNKQTWTYSGCKCLSPATDRVLRGGNEIFPSPVPPSPLPSESFLSGTVSEGLCTKGCWKMYAFFPMFGMYVLLAFSGAIPIQEGELRSVPFDQRSLAFGIRWVFIRLLGTIPGPLIFGAFVDRSCTAWNTDKRGKLTDCPLYNNKALSTFIVSCGSVLKALVIVSLGWAWYFSRKSARLSPYDEDLRLENQLDPETKDIGCQANNDNAMMETSLVKHTRNGSNTN